LAQVSHTDEVVLATVTVSELQTEGTPPAAHEAVAIVLTLMEAQLWGGAAAPHDERFATLPSPSTISLGRDGSVSCPGPVAKLSPAEIATLLQQILEDTSRVPPGLLFAIARGLRAVEAPPFESSEALFIALARFERGARRDVLSGLVARFESAVDSRTIGTRRPERRSMPPLVTHLRRELRAVDRREYEQQAPAAAAPAAALRARRQFGPLALGVCLATALACFAAGAALDIAATPVATGATATATAATPAQVDRDDAQAVHGETRQVPAIRPASTIAPAAPSVHSAAAVPHSAIKPTVVPKAVRRRSGAAHASKMSRLGAALRFEWLRHRFAIVDDL
jgi:hypothetical protein